MMFQRENNSQSSMPKPKQSDPSPKNPPTHQTRPTDREPLPQPKRPKPAPTQTNTADDEIHEDVSPQVVTADNIMARISIFIFS